MGGGEGRLLGEVSLEVRGGNATSGQYELQFGTHSLRVLTVTTTHRRLVSLQRATARVARAGFFLFATLADGMEQDVFVSPI